MRIIGGKWGGRALVGSVPEGTRPTGDEAREALFNILTSRFGMVPHRVLEFFAGTAAVSFEALSRGAEHAVVFEKNPKAIGFIQKNAAALGAEPQISVRNSDLSKNIDVWVDEVNREGAKNPFDFVFVDPPYSSRDPGVFFRALPRLVPALREDAVIVIERSSQASQSSQRSARQSRKNPSGLDWQEIITSWQPWFHLEHERSRGAASLLFLRKIAGVNKSQ